MSRSTCATWVLAGSVATASGAAHAEDVQKPEIELVESGPFVMKDKRGYDNLVVLGPRLIPPGIGGRYIRSLDDHLAVMIGGGYAGWRIFGLELQHVDLRAGLDYQPLGNGLHGFYVGPRVVYRSFLGTVEGEGLTTETLSIGGVAGWRFVWVPGVSLGLGLGAAQTTWTADVLDEEQAAIAGTMPIVELTVGWAF